MDSLYDDLHWRGLVYQVTDEERARAALRRGGGLVAYIGFDPTASSLHVGSLLPITLLMRLQAWGHRPLAVVGGGTGLIGDPSGKSAERKLLDRETLAGHVAGLRRQLGRFVDFTDDRALLVDNVDWLGSLGLLDFLRDIGKHFSVGAMIARDSVKTRLETREQGISYTEFSYMLLQAYDFLALWRRHGCRAQFGGSDQWGNIVSGVDLIDRLGDAPENQLPFGLTVPLLTTKNGQKFGKTEAGTVWLDGELTSPYRFYQFWINADDDDTCRYLRLFTFLDRGRIEAVEAEHRDAPHLRTAQKVLAAELTTMVHGQAACRQAEAATAVLFGGDPHVAPAEAFDVLRAEVPAFVSGAETCADVLVGAGRPFASNGEAKRALQAGSVYFGGERFSGGLGDIVPSSAWSHQDYLLIRVGKKQYWLAEKAF
jgi:tyrosyl-tRNA synthetase